MAKITRTITIEFDVWENAKNMGINISQFCENALSNATKTKIFHWTERIPEDELKRCIKIVMDDPNYANGWARKFRNIYEVQVTSRDIINHVMKIKRQEDKNENKAMEPDDSRGNRGNRGNISL